MLQTQQILKSVNKQKPKIFTLYTNVSNLRMLDGFEVYCLVNPMVAEPRTIDKENLSNVLFVNTHNALEFDLCVSFSGGLWGKILKDIAKERMVDCVIYEMNYPKDIGTQIKYMTNDDSISPCLAFADVINGKANLVPPCVSPEFGVMSNVLDRPVSVCTNCDYLIEHHLNTNYDDLHYLFNTIPSQIFGFNPKMGTPCLSIAEFAQVLNSSKIYINTRTHEFFPTELLQAMACGCAVLSYDYPGVSNFIGEEFVCKNKEEARQKISKFLGNKELLSFVSQQNAEKAKAFKLNLLRVSLNNIWEDICEFGYKQYRV